MAPGKGCFSNQHGQSLLEFAMVLPFLFLLLFGAIDLGRVFHAGIILTNVAREGARHGSIYPGATASEIAAVAQGEVLEAGIDPSSIVITRTCTDISPADGTCDSGFPIRVTVTYHFPLIFGGLIFVDQVPITRYVEMYVP